MDWGRVVSKAVAIGFGAAVGANLRYFAGWWARRSFESEFPWGTFAINLCGSFLIGLAAAFALRNDWDDRVSAFVIVGALGGFTTFSAFSSENLEMLRNGRYDLLAFNILGSVMIGLALAWGGFSLAQKLQG